MKFDGRALREGALVALMFAAPLTVVALVFFDNNKGSGWAGLLTFGAFIGFVIGAGQAAWRQELNTPLAHGIVTAGGVFVAVQGVIVIAKLVAGSDVHWARIFFSLSLALLAGLIGGTLGSSLNKRGVRPSR